MNEEQKELTERILAIYRKYDKVFDFFEYYIDDQEVYEDFERLFKTPEAILKEYPSLPLLFLRNAEDQHKPT